MSDNLLFGRGRDRIAPDLSSLAAPRDHQLSRPPAVRRGLPWPTLVSALLIAGVNVLVVADLRLPFLEPAAGFWFLLVLPVYLLCTTSLWRAASGAERLGYSLATVLLLLMLAGLIANVALPLFGVARPLDPIPILVLGDVLTVSLYFLRRLYPAEFTWRAHFTGLSREEGRLLFVSALCVALAVLGANRLNNGAGDQVSLAALAVALGALLLLLYWQRQIREGIISVALYLLSLGLLLMTSLRGWYVTGHDIQTEFQVFQLAEAHGRWDISAFHNAYNACLSITILPTELGHLIHVDSPYIYKVFFQIIFAVCPVLTYTIARRYWPVSTAILAGIYFISFPTFFTDMPFLNRQEIAFIFICAAVLAITNDSWSIRRRRLTLIAISIGVELSHYSSMYLFFGTLFAAWVARRILSVRHRYRRRRAAHGEAPPWSRLTQTAGIGTILAIGGIVFVWGYLATQTAGVVLTDVHAAFSALFGHSASARASNVGYSFLFSKTPTFQAVLNDYRHQAFKIRAASAAPSPYIAAHYVYQYSTHVININDRLLPLTAAGRFLSGIGIPVAVINSAIRLLAAEGEQLFIFVGLIAFLLLRRLKRQIDGEFFVLCVGSTLMIVIVTVLPNLSVDYGVLRVFQGALILIAPVLVTGSMMVFRPLGEVWAYRTAAAVCIGIFISTTALLPQLLGGYSAQLSLNNSGQYYDSYYTHPQDQAAVQWLAFRRGVLPSGVQATYSPNRYLFTAPSDVTGQEFIEDAFPPLVRQHSWVILGYSTLHGDVATASYSGDLIPYKYPLQILQLNKDLVYDNGGAEIYK